MLFRQIYHFSSACKTESSFNAFLRPSIDVFKPGAVSKYPMLSCGQHPMQTAPCAFKRTVVITSSGAKVTRKVATKEHKRYAKGLIEKLESRIHCGPRIEHGEL